MLKSIAKKLAYRATAATRLPRLLHKTFFADKLTIVTYHGIVREPLKIYDWCFLDEESFRRQAIYLKKHFEVLPLSTAVEALKSGRISRPTAAITFDDGYHNNYTVAFPILKELSLPATIFLTTHFIDTDDTFWNLRLNLSLADTTIPSLSWDGETLDLCDLTSRSNAYGLIKKSLKYSPRSEAMPCINDIVRELGYQPDTPIGLDSPFRILTSAAVEEMAKSGLIEFGAHTHAHPRLSQLSHEECRNEIEVSVDNVQKLAGRACTLFAYPFGGREDYNQDSIDILRRLNIAAAVTTVTGANDKDTPALELRRCGAGAGEGMAVFQTKVHHLRIGHPQNETVRHQY